MTPRVAIRELSMEFRDASIAVRAGEIYRILRGLVADGIALLVVSSDLPEVLALASRTVVMADGVTVGELPGDSATEEAVLRLVTSSPAAHHAA